MAQDINKQISLLKKRGQKRGYEAGQKAIALVRQFPERFADILIKDLYVALQDATDSMDLCEQYYTRPPDIFFYEKVEYWFAYRLELECYLFQYEQLERIYKGNKAAKTNSRAPGAESLLVYFKGGNALLYMQHRQALAEFLKRTRRDKKHRIMSVWHYLKQSKAITDPSETPYRFCVALHKEFYNGIADGSAYQGRYKEELCAEYEAILRGA